MNPGPHNTAQGANGARQFPFKGPDVIDVLHKAGGA